MGLIIFLPFLFVPIYICYLRWINKISRLLIYNITALLILFLYSFTTGKIVAWITGYKYENQGHCAFGDPYFMMPFGCILFGLPTTIFLMIICYLVFRQSKSSKKTD
jgi:hypothetical protein